MTNKVEIEIISDPGHAWGVVNYSMLKELRIEDKISTYSYRKGSVCYLEEDCDLSRLVDALVKQGKEITFKESFLNHEAPLRNFRNYYKD